MSKLDAQRAMHEANWARRQKAAGAQPAPLRTRPTPTRTAPVAAPAAPATAETAPAATTEAACGHRSMNGRTCTRPSGHAEKNHRYG